MKNNIRIHVILFLAFGLISVSTNAALIDRGGGLIYDTDLNVSWLSDANLAATNTFGLSRNVDLGPILGVNTYGGSYIYDDGRMTWGGAMKWVDAMNAASYLGYHDWRLPAYNPISEMSHLYYNEFGGCYGCFLPAIANNNFSLFTNFQLTWNGYYWTGTESVQYEIAAYYFDFLSGDQGDQFTKQNAMFAMAVRPGDVSAVPIPAAFWLFGSGLVGLIGVARRKKAGND
jgi:hypothetical protein